ncbi:MULTISPECIES: FtsW/RodA/SpoVE family cell cycle protein [Sphingomonadales]|uniref:Probable peptidoglycan glycosyltransferase FtsW n=1 Tax=Edaphosphingomonas haloaromaticamans TaxID=653954 RepID=A0A1S1HGB7_9SPHN|nr:MULTISPECIES: putative peptidoglycan glycosyltransferase FtsW [Sphingomonas]AGH48838.1 cell division protein FtsW [Sphingomonas sp. MM-1]MDX3885009.1 putative peptidoglycan glycosyltransferase FtsW [Sphingomonas sp.]OHT21265.1 Lipid II flippase FtsW [Sphingomonas haloaromaticamans]
MTGSTVYRQKPSQVVRLGRADRSWYATWFWEIDRVLLLLVAMLIGIGLIAVAAASPSAAAKDGLPALHYFWRQIVWIMLGVPLMIAVSMLPRDSARRLSIGAAVLFSLLLALVPIAGTQVNGAVRWLGVDPFRFQPSEFLKPFFVVATAWMLSLRARDRGLPVVPLTGLIVAVIAALLMKQPDFGQTVIFCSVWAALLVISGVQTRFLMALGGAGVGLLALAFVFYRNGRDRVIEFLTGSGDTYHVDVGYATITNGGLVGLGPGGGVQKFRLPEAHNDYIFSVIGEEFGLISCIVIAIIYLAIMVRVFLKLLDEEDQFVMLAASGLAIQFGLQAVINMAVNVQLVPSKGMTLPFISYGGSSLLAVSMGFGLLLAFTRRNPFLTRSPYVVTWSGK